ncbi:paraquat-inducible protein A [Dyella solisilvae]|uniref:Paraquat-inducible protein A n=1 Tax=Dyella solisilvae TaxID=1920168 RepID=A0A370KD51_9GAMM|nr:paraquat-inducible protein A [Dyella solisilvae]RDJ00051.1 paraquat-inducible protein A [Dyella solisilvae]
MTMPVQGVQHGIAPPTLWICEHCDTVFRRRVLACGEVARCARCDAILARHHRVGVRGMLALVLTAMIAFIQGNIWPIVTLGLNGHLISTTLWGCIVMMWNEHAQVVSVIAAMTLFFIPIFKMGLLGWVLLYARKGERAPGFRLAMVTLHRIGPWTMSEVFVLGTLVAIVKAHMYFDVVPNAGIFAYGVLMLIITAFASIDVRELWDLTEERRA